MIANWVRQAVSAGGTGNLTLGSADAGFIDLNTGIGQGPRFTYVIEDGSNREVGIGYLSASTTLVRATVLETLVSGTYDKTSPSAINVTTSAKVMLAPIASQTNEQPYSICGDYGDTGYIMDAGATGSSTLGGLANRFYMMSFHLPCRAEISGMGFEVTTPATGNAVVGLYQAVSRASSVKIAQTDQMDTSTAGVKTSSFLTGNLVLNPGYHIVTLHLQAACTNRSNYGTVGHLGGLTGVASTLGARYMQTSYNATMPATLDSADFNGSSSSTPRIILLGS